MEDQRVFDENNPPPTGPWLDEGCPYQGLCTCASPALPKPRNLSLELYPPSVPSSTESPGALLQALLPSMPPRLLKESLAHLGPGSRTEGSQDLQALSLVARCGPQPHRAPGWVTGMAQGGRGKGVLGGGISLADWGGSIASPVLLCSFQLLQDRSRAE